MYYVGVDAADFLGNLLLLIIELVDNDRSLYQQFTNDQLVHQEVLYKWTVALEVNTAEL